MSACGPRTSSRLGPDRDFVSGKVLLSEYTGASSLLHVELPGGEVFLVAHEGRAPDAGSPLGLAIAPERLHYFDQAGLRTA